MIGWDVFVFKNCVSMVPFCPFLKCLRELKWILGKALQDSANLVLEDDTLIKITKIVTANATSQWTTSECHTQCKILSTHSLNVSYKPMRYTLALFLKKKKKKKKKLTFMKGVTGSLLLRIPWIIVTSWLSTWILNQPFKLYTLYQALAHLYPDDLLYDISRALILTSGFHGVRMLF